VIVGLGSDLVDVARFRRIADRFGDGFLESLFSPAEVRACRCQRRPWEQFAARFAAREAVLKALGTGLAAGMSWKDIEVLPGPAPGVFAVALRGGALEAFTRLGATDAHLAMTTTREVAAATVVIV
jgi:holo-[acyl-carrier protein] synthase